MRTNLKAAVQSGWRESRRKEGKENAIKITIVHPRDNLKCNTVGVFWGAGMAQW